MPAHLWVRGLIGLSVGSQAVWSPTVIVENVVSQLSRGRQDVAVREGKTVAIIEELSCLLKGNRQKEENSNEALNYQRDFSWGGCT